MKFKKQSALVIRILAMIVMIILLTAADQATKYLAVHYLKGSPIELLPGILSLHYLENKGVGFGLFQGRLTAILVMNVVILAVVCYMLVRLSGIKRMRPLCITLVFVVAGALGNMIDRIRLGYVVDFISFDLIHFPIFNVSDIYVTVSVIVFALLYCFYCKNGELEGYLRFPLPDRETQK